MAIKYKFGSIEHKKSMFANAKYRAKCLGIEFKLNVQDLNIPESCPVLHIPLSAGNGQGGSHNSATLDRLDPSIGYTVDNTAVISMQANRMKSDCTPDEIMRVAMWTQRKIGRVEALHGQL